MTLRDDKKRAAYHQMAEGMRRLEIAPHGAAHGREAVPDAWHAIAQGTGPGRKERVHLWVEADVLRFFRSLGAGHTTRMAEVLATFMHARLAGVVKGPEDVDYSKRLRTLEEEAVAAARDARLDAMQAKVAEGLRRR